MTHKLNRLLALMLAVIMAFSMLLVPVEAASFRDINDSAWYAAAVEYVNEKGWMAGVSESSFAPNKEVTRGMMVTVLARLAEAETDNDTAAFADTAAGKWYTGAAAWAAENGIVAGVGNGRFSPNRAITRQDLCVMLKGYIDAMGIELKNDIDRTFSDMESVAGYAREAVIYCTGVGLVSGFEDSSFRPKDTATRAQLAQILMRLDLLLKGEEAPTEPMPAQSFNGNADADMTVNVEAPAGALPQGTCMELERVSGSEELAALAAQIDCDVLAAANITFTKDGAEIEPETEVEVKINVVGLDGLNNPAVVHIKDDGSFEHVDSEVISNRSVSEKTILFYAKSFSVYAIIDDDPTVARATVNFYRGSELLATIYVKASDDTDAIEQIVYDPGIGELSNNQLFKGWCKTPNYDLSTEKFNIRQIKDELEGMSITSNITINYYAMICGVYYITYNADGLCYGTTAVELLLTETSAEHKVSMTYTADSESNFVGWMPVNGSDNILKAVLPDGTTLTKEANQITSETVLPNDTIITVSGDVTFDVKAPKGHWLVFHENPDRTTYKGATYIAPQFLETNDKTVDPQVGDAGIPMKCPGYTFDGWYLGTTDTQGNFTGYGAKFTFGGTIDTLTDLYAKWTPSTSAFYTIIYWKENIECDGYDFIESRMVTNQTPGAAITFDQSSYTAPTGFEFKETDIGTGENAKTVAANNSTVVNVYYQRKTFTLTFKTGNSNYPAFEYKTNSGYDLMRVTTAYNTYVYAIKINDKWYQFTGNNVSETWSNYRTIRDDSNVVPGGYVRMSRSGSNYYQVSISSTEYTLPTDSSVVKTITAKYQMNLSDYFPIVGTNGTTYTGGRWVPGTNSQGWSQVMSYIDTMPAESITFTLDTQNRPTKTVNYYIESDEEGATAGPATLYTGTSNTVVTGANNKKFILYKTVDMKYNGVTEEDITAINGYDRLGADQQGQYVNTSDGNVFFYVWNTSTDQTINFYYVRQEFDIVYRDGSYFGGKDGKDNMNVVRQGNPFHTAEDIPFNSDISGYGDKTNTTLYYTPTSPVDGYVFAGWYVDDSCSAEYEFDKMPLGGVLVYAKWVQIRYRVFLHPNAERDSTLNWGSADQEMNFGVAWGDKISAPTGTRNGYLFLGWTRADGSAFNANYIQMTDETVPADPVYDKTVDMTDTMDKWGEVHDPKSNSDADRFFVTRKLDLYAKWRKVVEGAEGIGVIYDLDGGTGKIEDTNLYPDNTQTAAQGAPTAPAGKQFLHWAVLKWESEINPETTLPYVVDEETDEPRGQYVDTGIIVYPGDKYTILLDNAKPYIHNYTTIPDPDHEGQTIVKILDADYTIMLKAVYGPLEVPTPSHIYWYANNGTDGFDKMNRVDANSAPVELVQINQGYLIPTQETWRNTGTGTRGEGDEEPEESPDRLEYANHVFLGWARVITKADGLYKDDNTTKITDPITDLTASDLFLAWKPETTVNGQTVAAHYEAKKVGTDTWVDVTQVGCDEVTPYHDLYAVWSNCFYIYHSSDGDLQAVQITQVRDGDGTAPVNLTEYVKDGYFYGGYYNAYGGVELDNVGTAKGQASSTLHAHVADAVNYTGAYIYTDNSDKPKFDRDENGKIKFENGLPVILNKKFWDKSAAYDISKSTPDDPVYAGTELVPTAGAVYYLKEVPNDYLASKLVYVVDQESHSVIVNAYEVAVIDDTNYSKYGIHSVAGNSLFAAANEDLNKGRVVNTFTLVSYEDEGNALTVSPSTFDNVTGGMICVVDKSSNLSSTDLSYTMYPGIVTLDGYTVNMHPTNYVYDSEHKNVVFNRDPEDFDDNGILFLKLDDYRISDWYFEDGSETRVYFFEEENNGKTEAWTEVAKHYKDGYYYVQIPEPSSDDAWTTLIVCRMNGGTEAGWDNRNLQSDNVGISSGNNLLYVWQDGPNTNLKCSWGTFNP